MPNLDLALLILAPFALFGLCVFLGKCMSLNTRLDEADETTRMRAEREAENRRVSIYWQNQRKAFDARQRQIDEQRKRWAS